MHNHNPSGPGAYDSDPEEEFLRAFDARIQSEARRVIPSELFSTDVLDLEVEDLAQEIRIKLWTSHRKRPITHPKSYIGAIARTTAVDLVRGHRPAIPLLGDTDDEPGPGDFLVAQSEGCRDPHFEFELREIDSTLLKILAEAILALPPRQQRSILLALKEHKDDTLPLLNLLKSQGIDIQSVEWPEEEYEIHLLKASLAVARKKLRYLLAEFMEG
jgi:DNA-directed RNA polymerase specialized sigma24 family protein